MKRWAQWALVLGRVKWAKNNYPRRKKKARSGEIVKENVKKQKFRAKKGVKKVMKQLGQSQLNGPQRTNATEPKCGKEKW